MTQKKMLLLFNPKAGLQKFSANLFEAVNKFTSAGFLVTVYPTQAPGEISKIISCYAENYDYVVCSGGDGTIGEAIDALIPLEKKPVFGLIPSGTVNDFATSLGIPKDILASADVIINGTAKPLDIGQFGDKHFSYIAAFGKLTDVSYSTPQNIKNVLGNLAYFLEVIKRVGSRKLFNCELILDDEIIKGDFILGLIANTLSVGGFKLPEKIDAQMDDGLFDIILLKNPKTLKDRQNIMSYLTTQENGTDFLMIRKTKKVIFKSAEPVAWTLDGDFGGEHKEIIIENKHHAIDIMIPAVNN